MSPPPAPRGEGIGGRTFLLATCAAVIGVSATWSTKPLGTSLEIGLACALAVFGVGLAVSSLYGRTSGGTMVSVVLTATLLAGAAALPKSVTADWRERTWQATESAELRDRYELGTGYAKLDLTKLRPGRGRTLGTHASVGAGKLQVTVPADVKLRLTVAVGFGDIELPGERGDDVDVAPRRSREVTIQPQAGGEDTRHAGARSRRGRGTGGGGTAMKRHTFEPGRLIAGAAALAVGVGYALDAAGTWDPPPFALLPALGVGLVFAALITAVDPRDAPPPQPRPAHRGRGERAVTRGTRHGLAPQGTRRCLRAPCGPGGARPRTVRAARRRQRARRGPRAPPRRGRPPDTDATTTDHPINRPADTSPGDANSVDTSSTGADSTSPDLTTTRADIRPDPNPCSGRGPDGE